MARTPNKLARDKFIEEYIANGGIKLKAAKKLGLAYSNVKSWFSEPEFIEQVAKAEEQWFDAIRAALMRRAIEKSDMAAFFLMKAHDPENYDDNIRRIKYLHQKGIPDPDAERPIQVVLLRDDDPISTDSYLENAARKDVSSTDKQSH